MGSDNKVVTLNRTTVAIMNILTATLLVGSLSLAHSLDCGDGKIRGVNTGGWLVLEPWITPNVFEEVNYGENFDKVVDEYTYAEFVDPLFQRERLRLHWDSFVSKEDFEKVLAAGVTHIRIPVGYWYWDVIDGEPFPAPNMDDTDKYSALFYLKRALVWLDELGMKAEIDLHAGPGSQNGFDNSGRRGDITWVTEEYPEDNHNVVRTLDILDKMGATLSGWVSTGVFKQETLYGISLLNEPGGWWDKVWSACKDEFYPLGYEVIRKHFPDESVAVNLQQAFRAPADFVGMLPQSEGYAGVSVDWHRYLCFDDYWAGQAEQRPEGWESFITASCGYAADQVEATWPTFNGEFCLSLTDCTKYLNGGFHTPYVPPVASEELCSYYNNDWVTYDQDYKDFLRRYFIAQVDAFEEGEMGAGWFMWTMKTEGNCAPEWDFIFLLEQGVIPENLCERESVCQFNN